MKQVILWDWDNTLADSFGAIYKAQNLTRAQFGLPPWSRQEVRDSMNHSGRYIFQQVFGDDRAHLARQAFINYYSKLSGDVKLKPHARKVVAWTKQQGFINIVASNKQGNILRNEVQAVGLQDYFDKVVGAQDCAVDKPHLEFTDFALAEYKPTKIWAIGDGNSDILMAKNYKNGVSILVGDPTQCTDKPAYVCRDLSQVLEILKPEHIQTKLLSNHGRGK